MHPEPWWMIIPFALVIAPPVGLLLACLALWRSDGGLQGARDRRAARQAMRRTFTPPRWVEVHEAANRGR